MAAPTAGLHFTPELFARLAAARVETAFVTLHVGAGTFLPVKTEDLADHRMHAEWGEVDAATADRLNAVRQAGGLIVCVGTTSLRLLESSTGEVGTIRPFLGDTAIFITPGYAFRAADGLITNFHLPRSTLFMLVSAFGRRPGDHARGLRPRHRGGLPVLFLRRRQPHWAGRLMAAFPFEIAARDEAARAGLC